MVSAVGLYPDGLQHSLLAVIEVVGEHGIAGLLCKLAQEIGEIGLGGTETPRQHHPPAKSCSSMCQQTYPNMHQDPGTEGNTKERCRKRSGIKGKGWSRGKRVGAEGRAHQQLQVVGKAGAKCNTGADWVGASPSGV